MLRRIVIIGLLLGFGGCGKDNAATPSPAEAAAPRPPLVQALSSLPAGDQSILFTDWAAIKRYEGKESLTSASPDEERMAFIRSTNTTQAIFSGFGVDRFATHRDTWGWDSTDLVWEVQAGGDGPPLYVLSLRADFDLAPVAARFEERGFAKSQAAGATLYSHPLDLKADWLQRSELAIVNTAVLTQSKILVMSSSPERVKAVLAALNDEAPSAGDDQGLGQAISIHGEVASALISRGPQVCDLAAIDPRSTPQQQAQQQSANAKYAVHAYDALIIGYGYADGQPIGRISMHYASHENAAADAAPRRSRFEEGASLTTRQPYQALMTLGKIEVLDTTLTMDFSFENSRVGLIARMAMARDLIFAACQ